MLISAFLGRLIFSSALLSYAAWSDLTRREVDNWVPITLVTGGIGFSIYDAITDGNAMPVVLALVTAGIAFAIALAIFYAGSMGGADCKIFIGISAIFPLVISSPLPQLSETNPFIEGGRRLLPMFSLSWLINSLLVSLVVPLSLLLRNLWDLARGRIPKVDGRTIPAFFVGYRTPVKDLRPSFVIPLERFEEVDGRMERVLHYSRRVLEEEEERKVISEVKNRLSDDDLVWAFPYIPFIVPMLVAFFLTLVFGDLLANLMISL